MKNDTPDAVDEASADAAVRETQDDPHRLAAIFRRWRPLQVRTGWQLRHWRGQWQVWEGRRYRVLPETELRGEVTRLVKIEFDRWAKAVARKSDGSKAVTVAKVTAPLVSNVMHALRSEVLISSEDDQPFWVESKDRGPVIALQNGLVDIKGLLADGEGVLKPHSPDWFSPVALDYAYDRSATYPQFLTFLDEMFEHDAKRIALVQEWFGYCLIPDTSFQKLLILIGDGANGKTVLLGVLVALLGSSNVSTVPLELFGERFQLATTLGKLANVVAEVGPMTNVAEGFLKSFVAGDPMHFDRKHLSPMTARPTARLIVATNRLPPFADPSSGIWRRLTILPCTASIPPATQDRHLLSTLMKELPGILLWSIDGLRRLRTQERFTEPAMCRDEVSRCRREANPARVFLEEEVVAEVAASIECQKLYSAYRDWCRLHGFMSTNASVFGHHIARVYPVVKRQRSPVSRGVGRPWRYVGIALATNTDVALEIPTGPEIPSERAHSRCPRCPTLLSTRIIRRRSGKTANGVAKEETVGQAGHGQRDGDNRNHGYAARRAPADALPALLTVEDVATSLRTTRRAVYELIAGARLPGVLRIGRRIRIRKDALAAFLRQKSAPSLNG
jgi:P4 family phage/plasmid primase-like protien